MKEDYVNFHLCTNIHKAYRDKNGYSANSKGKDGGSSIVEMFGFTVLEVQGVEEGWGMDATALR